MAEFKTSDAYSPMADQPKAIAQLSEGIAFPETRQYVDEVLNARDIYADTYADELGLD